MAITLRAVAQMSTKRCKKSLFLIPFCFTFANAFFGFLSVIEALRGNVMLSALCIGFAACADALDGRLARALGSSSYLGAELDALCDACMQMDPTSCSRQSCLTEMRLSLTRQGCQ